MKKMQLISQTSTAVSIGAEKKLKINQNLHEDQHYKLVGFYFSTYIIDLPIWASDFQKSQIIVFIFQN